jgi:hypothetical protein
LDGAAGGDPVAAAAGVMQNEVLALSGFPIPYNG